MRKKATRHHGDRMRRRAISGRADADRHHLRRVWAGIDEQRAALIETLAVSATQTANTPRPLAFAVAGALAGPPVIIFLLWLFGS